MSLLKNKEELQSKKSIIIYFSRIGENYMSDGIRNIDKGNTEVIAEYIKDIVGADIFKVGTIIEYPYNYKECIDIASKEKKQDIRPELKKYLDNIDNYEVIYIGYPNWWGTMPMAMMSLLEKLNFSGKIVMPFCTHEGSGMGNSETDIKNICRGAEIKSGLAIQGSMVNKSKEKVEKWIK